jgi:hypothetical protein
MAAHKTNYKLEKNQTYLLQSHLFGSTTYNLFSTENQFLLLKIFILPPTRLMSGATGTPCPPPLMWGEWKYLDIKQIREYFKIK